MKILVTKNNMKKKNKSKKVAKKQAKKQVKVVRNELVVRVAPQVMPTTKDLAEPISDGKVLAMQKTWVSDKQIMRLVERTPAKYVYQRPGKGGGKWDYVTVSYVQRVLDYVFGFNWDFEIVEHGKEDDHVWVLGKLTVKNPEGTRTIVKTQFGRSDVKQKKDNKGNLDYGNDLKAAASDALKKCASMFGIARDIYGKGDYKSESGKEPVTEAQQAQTVAAQEAPKEEVLHYCYGQKGSGCPNGNETIDQRTYDYSMKAYKKSMCRQCQNEK